MREEKLRATNRAQQRAALETRITDLEAECSSLQQQIEKDSAKREPLDAKKRQYLRWGSHTPMVSTPLVTRNATQESVREQSMQGGQ